jgi:hypothetical protein
VTIAVDDWIWKLINYVSSKEALATLHGGEALNAHERVVWLVSFSEGQIAQDGIDGFFFNFPGAIPSAGVDALRDIGCMIHSQILQKALDLLPDYAKAPNLAESREALGRLGESVKLHLKELTKEWFKADSTEDVYDHLREYAQRHADAFPAIEHLDTESKALNQELSKLNAREKQRERETEKENARLRALKFEELAPKSGAVLRALGKQGDFTPASLWSVADLIDDRRRTGKLPAIFQDDANVFDKLLTAYLGEVVRRAKGGRWAAMTILKGTDIEGAGIQIDGSEPFSPLPLILLHGKEGRCLVHMVEKKAGINVGPRPRAAPWWMFWKT